MKRQVRQDADWRLQGRTLCTSVGAIRENTLVAAIERDTQPQTDAVLGVSRVARKMRCDFASPW